MEEVTFFAARKGELYKKRTSLDKFYSESFSRALHVIVHKKDLLLSLWSFPFECISYIPESPILNSKMTKQDHNIVFIWADKTDNANIDACRAVLNVFNNIPAEQFRLIVPVSQLNILSPFANSNVSFIKFDPQTAYKYAGSAKILLASGPFAACGLLRGIPVISIGNKGLGGIVTDQNYLSLLNEEFRGRPGAQQNEMILIRLLSYFLKKLLNNISNNSSEITTLSDASKADIRKKLIYEPLELSKEIEKSCKRIAKHLHNDLLRKKLILKLAGNIQIKIKDRELHIINIPSNKEMMICSISFSYIFKNIDGKKTFEEIINLGKSRDSKSIEELIMSMWEQKIIVLI